MILGLTIHPRRGRCAHIALVRVIAVIIGIPLAGCVSSEVQARQTAARVRATTIAKDAKRASSLAERPPYRLSPGDAVALRFFYNPELDETITIRPDGRFSLRLVGEIDAAGESPADLRETLTKRYKPFLRNVDVSVNITSYGARVAFVGGQVRDPGVIPLTPGLTALQAVFAAGGSVDTAEMRKVVVLRDRGDGEAEFLMLDLKSGLNNLTAFTDVPLQPKDIIFVPMSGIAKADQFVRQYINELLPLSKSFNVTYQFGQIGLR